MHISRENKISKAAGSGKAHVPYENESHSRLPAVSNESTDSMDYILKIILQHDNLTHVDMSIQEKDTTQKKRTGQIQCMISHQNSLHIENVMEDVFPKRRNSSLNKVTART